MTDRELVREKVTNEIEHFWKDNIHRIFMNGKYEGKYYGGCSKELTDRILSLFPSSKLPKEEKDKEYETHVVEPSDAEQSNWSDVTKDYVYLLNCIITDKDKEIALLREALEKIYQHSSCVKAGYRKVPEKQYILTCKEIAQYATEALKGTHE